MRFLKSKYQAIFLLSLIILTCGLITLPKASGQVIPVNSLNNLLNPVDDSVIVQRTVRLDGQELFQITAPRVSEDESRHPPISRRVGKIENRLSFVVNSDFDINSLQIFYKIKNNLPVIYAAWEGRERPYELMTVTPLDAEINGIDSETHVMELIPIIHEGIIQAKSERKPEFLQRQLGIAFVLLLGMSLITGLVCWRENQLKNQWKILSENAPSQPLNTQANEQTKAFISYQKKIDFNKLQRQAAQIFKLIIGYTVFFVILGLFPQTRSIQLILSAMNSLLIITIIFYICNRLTLIFVDQFITALEDSSFLVANPDVSRRRTLRAYTLTRAFKSIAVVVWLTIWIITILTILQVNSASILAAGSLIGLALSIIFNDLIRDIINGIFILIDDQFAVGDFIAVGELSGKVENINLRITQLRSTNGNLITLPNRIITSIQNFSNGWSQVDLTLNVDYNTDVDQALQVVDQVAQTMNQDPIWSFYILEPPRVLGVDQLDHSGIGIRIFIKTKPLEQWPVAREYRRRLKIAFDQHNISIGIPQQSIQFTDSHRINGATSEKH
ncbi:MAG: mechanosensitive ion channel family protein [Planktothrix sp.]